MSYTNFADALNLDIILNNICNEDGYHSWLNKCKENLRWQSAEASAYVLLLAYADNIIARRMLFAAITP